MNNIVGVAVLDTGLYKHIDFDKRIIAFKDCVNHRTYPYDDSGHGTHVCGIIGGSGYASSGRFRGIAPMANLIPVKVLDSKGNGNISDVIKGTMWILENKDTYNIKIVNISFGTTDNISNTKDLIYHVETLVQKGIVVVCAAGNNGPSPNTITAPGTSKMVITVGSMDDATFSSGRGPTDEGILKPELVVTGSNIIACSNRHNGYTSKSGTSTSAPIVSGAIARVLMNDSLTPEQIRMRLKSCCHKINIPPNQQGWGYLDILKFVTMD